MLVSYKEKMFISIVIILDGVITYFIPSYYNNINYLYPMLTVTLIPFLYQKNIKDYYQLLFVSGIIYDLLHSNLFLFHPLVFLLLGKINLKILKYLKENLFSYLLLVIIDILIYDGIFFILVYTTNYQSITFTDYFYKIKYSLLNIIIGIIYYVLKVSNFNKSFN